MKKVNKIKCISYLRISSDLQKLKDNSIKNQNEFVIDYCSKIW